MSSPNKAGSGTAQAQWPGQLRPEGPIQLILCRPFRPLVITERKPVAHATGIGYVGPPGLNPNNLNLYFTWFKSGTAT
jgi:hypothetical protein